MRLMYKIAVIGSRDTVVGFKALGLNTFPVEKPEEARRTLRELSDSESGYAIIYIEENLAQEIKSDIDKLQERPNPAVILIPGREGSLGIGMGELYEAVDKAVGVSII